MSSLEGNKVSSNVEARSQRPAVRYPARLEFANLPTRIHRLNTLSDDLGVDIFIKRDDETGAELSGNKVRKLEFLLAEAHRLNADVVLTCGGVQSNHCRATAVAARRMGMDSLLFLRGEQPKDEEGRADQDGNLFLDLMVGAETRFITSEDYQRREEVLQNSARELEKAGRRPYIVPEGGSNELGSFGYVKFVEELIDQSRVPGDSASGDAALGVSASGDLARRDSAQAHSTLPWKHIVCATGSGGTLAGLVLGMRAFGLKTNVWGINVAEDAPTFQTRVASIATSFLQQFGDRLGSSESSTAPIVAPEEVNLIDGYVGPGYSQTYPEEIEFIRRVARTDGVLLDPVYTGKALYGLAQEIRAGRFSAGPILFIHTGGIFSMFSYRKELSQG